MVFEVLFLCYIVNNLCRADGFFRFGWLFFLKKCEITGDLPAFFGVFQTASAAALKNYRAIQTFSRSGIGK